MRRNYRTFLGVTAILAVTACRHRDAPVGANEHAAWQAAWSKSRYLTAPEAARILRETAEANQKHGKDDL